MSYLKTPKPRPSVAVIGGGFGGIGAAVQLKEAGFDRFTVLERAEGPGGTWWHNSYPGAEVDTPSVLYSYSFMPWKWTRTHVRQAELQEYQCAVIERFGLAEHMRFGVSVDQVVWDEQRQEWAIWSGGEEIMRANYVISAVGLLGDPRLPTWPGLDDFEGPKFHTAQWDHSFDPTNKRIAVVGSGSTAVQVVPALSEMASEVIMFQREPGWVVPKLARPYTEVERKALDSRVAQRVFRTSMLIQRERAQINGAVYRPGTKENEGLRKVAKDFIDRSLEGRPDLIEAVTPNYVFNGKRPIISDEFYPSLLRPNVTLVPSAVESVTKNGVIDVNGKPYEVDALVMSTGFKADFLTTFEVVGRDGRTIHEIWDGDETAFLGMMVEDVPNFFMLYGPNTNGGTILTSLELQVKYVLSAIRNAWKRGASSVEIRPLAMQVYDRWLQERLEGTTFHFENNYYRSASGRIATQWGDGVIYYGILTKLLRKPLWKFNFRVGESSPNKPQQAPPPPFRKHVS
ncbi:flavin-containing monooxygenase [Aeromicrobium sp. UC242_57]|uniref:flavin-containing monooxygenase n=1 Tax=Aeromicrobium sp. UC242_57 TaxID=3374624 RepID=UPI0037BC705B